MPYFLRKLLQRKLSKISVKKMESQGKQLVLEIWKYKNKESDFYAKSSSAIPSVCHVYVLSLDNV